MRLKASVRYRRCMEQWAADYPQKMAAEGFGPEVGAEMATALTPHS